MLVSSRHLKPVRANQGPSITYQHHDSGNNQSLGPLVLNQMVADRALLPVQTDLRCIDIVNLGGNQ